MLTNKNNSVLYTGFTNSLMRRIWEHKSELKVALPKNIMLQNWFTTSLLTIALMLLKEKNRLRLVQEKRKSN